MIVFQGKEAAKSKQQMHWCLPVVLNPAPPAFLRSYLWGIHAISLCLLCYQLPAGWIPLITLLLVVSLRLQLGRMEVLTGCNRLVLLSPQTCLLQQSGGGTDRVRLCTLRIIGSWMLVRLSRYGEPALLWVRAADQSPAMWHRARLLAMGAAGECVG
jgi:hypothetical protein